MESPKPTNKYPLVPPNEQKCVWMTAGILSYQLCDHQFDCDHCPLDSALRTFPQRSFDEQVQELKHTKAADKRKLIPGYLYSRKHCWIKSNEGNTVRIGLEPLFSSMLINSKTVVLPSSGERLQADKVCAWIVLEGGTLPIASPLDGEVCRTNAKLVDQPHDICSDPFERGWFFELTTNEDIFNQSSLFRMPEADRIYSEDERHFQTLVSTQLKKQHSSVGATLADGGKPVHDIAELLGPEMYFRLLHQVFS